MRDVNDEHCHCEDGRYPDESRICGFIHGGPGTHIMCKNTHRSLNFPYGFRKMINSF